MQSGQADKRQCDTFVQTIMRYDNYVAIRPTIQPYNRGKYGVEKLFKSTMLIM